VTERDLVFSHQGKAWRAAPASDGGVLIVSLAQVDEQDIPPAAGRPADAQVLADRGARLASELQHDQFAARRDALRRALVKARARLERRIDAITGDLERATRADALARQAQLFVSAAAGAPRGTARLTAVDWSSADAPEVAMDIDPSRSAREQIDALFKRARRLKEGARIGRARLADAEQARDAILALQAELSTREGDPDAIEASARAAAPRDFVLGPPAASAAPTAAKASRRAAPAAPPYRTFTGFSGKRILVGRAAERNDALTFRVARPHDLWLHTKNRAGAHVVVPLEKGAVCPPELLAQAAHLAVHFSEARGEANAEVQYTPRRYVRKPRGSAPGQVTVEREKVLVLRQDESTLRRLLAGESPEA
jgi:predicted ribosome quality control (RQC) complex YloA/Tae2 family protein